EKGDYFVSLYPFIKEHIRLFPEKQLNAIYDEQGHTSYRPWTAKQYQLLADWLKANEKPLNLVVEAMKRPHYYSPLVPGSADQDPPLLAVLIPTVQRCREFAGAINARAMLRVGERHYDDAWQDLLACHHLGRHLQRGGTLIDQLVGIAIEAIPSGAELSFLDHAKLDTKQLQKCLQDLQAL